VEEGFQEVSLVEVWQQALGEPFQVVVMAVLLAPGEVLQTVDCGRPHVVAVVYVDREMIVHAVEVASSLPDG